jgi:TPR repeat protein
VKQDFSEAVHLYEQAQAAGNAAATSNLRTMAEQYASLLEQDYVKVLEQFQQALEA